MTLEHEAVRDRLVETALALMEAGGLEEVKARAVAQAVGVSVGTVYNLYGTIDGLIVAANTRTLEALNALGRARMEGLEAELGRAVAKGEIAGSGRDKALFLLLGLARIYIDFVAGNAGRWNALLAFNRGRRAAGAPADYFARQDALIDIVGDVLTETPLGTDPQRRRVAARAIWSAVHGVVTVNYFGLDEEAARSRTWEQVELLVTAFVDGLGKPGAQ